MAKAPEYMNFFEVAGGDGVPAPDSGGTDPILAEGAADSSADDAALDAHIAEITGLPIAKTEVQGDDQATAGADNTDDNGNADANNGEPGKDDGGTQSGGNDEPAVVKPAPETPKPTKPEPETPVADKYTLEVEDAQGNKLSISKIEDLPEDFEPKNNRQALQIISDLAKLDTRREADEAQATIRAEETRVADETAKINQGWQTEIDGLITDGRIDKPKVKEGDPKFLEDPAIQRMDTVFKFMNEENQGRLSKGIAPIRSFTDALTHLELKEAREAKVTADRTATDTARRKAGLLSGSSATGSAAGGAERPYFAGQAQDISDLVR